MILQQALALGVIGFVVGKITATFAAPLFPKYVLLVPGDSVLGFFAVLLICVACQRGRHPHGAEGRSGRGDRRLSMAATGIRIEGLRKRYGSGDTAVLALKDVNMQVAPGEVVGLIGPSGSGKSTLLKCLGAVIDPTAGRMTLGDEVIYDDGWKVRDLRALRRDKIGFVFQAPYLIPFLDVTDNVALLPMLAGVAQCARRAHARWSC